MKKIWGFRKLNKKIIMLTLENSDFNFRVLKKKMDICEKTAYLENDCPQVPTCMKVRTVRLKSSFLSLILLE